ncbi:MAG: rod shape-determining protein MreC [Deltaproteobacteria bacterium]|nr:rod shape-determining protein MreC [Deltaproteobacteria bacterium]
MTIFFEHKPKWVAYIFVVLSVILLSLSIGKGQAWNPAEKLAIEVTAPIQKFFIGTIRFIRDIWSNYFFLVEARQEGLRLKAQIELLRLENSRYQEILLTNERLQDLLKFQENTDDLLLPAMVTGWDSSGQFKSIIIDKGAHDGVAMNMAVVKSEGVVGRVVSVSPHYSQVLLVTDQNCAIDGVVQSSRGRGMLKGNGYGECYFDYVIKTCEIKTGDAIVTSGLGGIFPKGLHLGRVKRVDDSPYKLFKDVRVVPAVDFNKLEEVLVILTRSFVPLGKGKAQGETGSPW